LLLLLVTSVFAYERLNARASPPPVPLSNLSPIRMPGVNRGAGSAFAGVWLRLRESGFHPIPGGDADFPVVHKNEEYRAVIPALLPGFPCAECGQGEILDRRVRRQAWVNFYENPTSQTKYYPDTFTHEISNEYSPHWNGPMIYDSINVYSVITETNGRIHRAMTRLTVGYTVNNGVLGIYALVMKVLPTNF
jgi:hypothetical protein